MTDSLDDAQRLNEVFFKEALSKRAPEQRSKGRCYNCDEPLQPGHKYCDTECRDDYEQRMRFRNLH